MSAYFNKCIITACSGSDQSASLDIYPKICVGASAVSPVLEDNCAFEYFSDMNWMVEFGCKSKSKDNDYCICAEAFTDRRLGCRMAELCTQEETDAAGGLRERLAYHCSYDFGGEGFEYLPACNGGTSTDSGSENGTGSNTPLPQDSGSPSDDSSPSLALPLGLGISLGCFVIIALIIVAIWYRRRRQQQQQRYSAQPPGPAYLDESKIDPGSGVANFGAVGGLEIQKQELEGSVPVVYQHQQARKSELDGESRFLMFGPKERSEVVEMSGEEGRGDGGRSAVYELGSGPA